jgi:cysteine-rich repeat protein
VQVGEQCDDGNAINTDGCLSTCKKASCGDGFVHKGKEECDDGNLITTDGCIGCQAAACGDGFTWTGVEQCDDANFSNGDGCLNTCKKAVCGDGFVHAGVEECDDGNADNTDGCNTVCKKKNCLGDDGLCGGACVNKLTDPKNCGSCGTTCPSTQICNAGTCSTSGCPAGQVICQSKCVNTKTDPQNCGSCGFVCSGGKCVGGLCSVECPIYHKLCGGTCIPVTHDPQNCGGCGVSCGGLKPMCSTGGCTAECFGPAFGAGTPFMIDCGGSCVSKLTDPSHCGGCGMPCASNQWCAQGKCVGRIAVGPAPMKCANGGSPIQIDLGGMVTKCAADIATTTFTFGLNSCAGVSFGNPSLIDAYDSTAGPYQPGLTGGGVGSNGGFSSIDPTTITGTLWSSGPSGVSFAQMAVKLELHAAGNVANNNPSSVDGNAFVKGNITANNTLTFAKDVHHEGTISGPVTIVGMNIQKTITVPPAQKCSPLPVDVPAIVDLRAPPNNDNALIGLDPNVLVGVTDGALVLPCGHYYLNGISASGALAIVATGHTALYIGGDVTSANQIFFLVSEPKYQLDVFVKGKIESTGDFKFGNPNYPAVTRLYASMIRFGNPTVTSGFLYGAGGAGFVCGGSSTATVCINDPFTGWGAVFAGEYVSTNDTTIHFDNAVLKVGDETCGDKTGMDPGGPPPAGCGSCSDCNNQACINGLCSSCTDSAQCCPPLQCIGGTCKIPVGLGN